MSIEDLKLELKKHIIKELNLLDIEPEDIIDEEPLFVEGLGLDSIDSLELVVIMDKFYGVKIKDEKEGRKILESINTMAAHIEKVKAAGN
jgi:acyl carrier protein